MTLGAVVFDLDGTLCHHGQPVHESMIELLFRFKRDVIPNGKIIIATASSFESTKTRLGAAAALVDFYHCNLGTRVYDLSNRLIRTATPRTLSPAVMRILEEARFESEFPMKSSPCVAARPPYYSFSVVGKNYPPEYRDRYIRHDRLTNERNEIVRRINVSQHSWIARRGGQTGIDLVPVGYGKEHVYKDLEGATFAFVGDDMSPGGGDHSLKREMMRDGLHRYVWDVSSESPGISVHLAYTILENEIANLSK